MMYKCPECFKLIERDRDKLVYVICGVCAVCMNEIRREEKNYSVEVFV